MEHIIISDIHLGSRHCLVDSFTTFLRHLPPGATLVMNGDVVDRWHPHLEGKHAEAMERLKEESFRRPVIWVRGNHDERYVPADPARMQLVSSYSIGRRLFVSHGRDFDTVMPYNRAFIRLFRLMHRVRILLGAESVHVAYYAKKFPHLYGVLRKYVAMNAYAYAKENGYEAVTCGHTHYAEERTIDGIRYLNTGSWTERPIHYVVVREQTIELVQLADTPAGAVENAHE